MKVYILYTGGTIGCIGDPLTPMTGSDFQKAFQETIWPILKNQSDISEIRIDYFAKALDSTNMQPADWVLIAEKIHANYHNHDGFVVLHGTDTMAWTAAALSFLLPGVDKPIFVTGSQVPLFVKTRQGSNAKDTLRNNTDALRNVLGALTFLKFRLPEVGLYFADRLYRGNRSVKSNASDFVAFSSPNYPVLGVQGVVPTLYRHQVMPQPRTKALSKSKNYVQVGKDLQKIAENITRNSVLQFLIFPGYYEHGNGGKGNGLLVSMLEQLSKISPDLKGIIFEAYGVGNIPDYPAMKELMQKLHQSGKILFDCTQVFSGDVNFLTYRTGAWLRNAGVISAHDISPGAALCKLAILLALYPEAPQSKLENLMRTNLAGEVTPRNRISGYENDFLLPGQYLAANSGDYMFVNDPEGGLKLLRIREEDAEIEWEISSDRPGRLIMQSDNNLVYYDQEGNQIWASKTAVLGHNSYLKLGDDGSLALFDLDTDEQTHLVYKPEHPTPNKNAPTNLRLNELRNMTQTVYRMW